MREREDEETHAEPSRTPQAKPEQRERERRAEQRFAYRLETDPDNPTIVRGVD
jgi:hypothetical protein